MELYLGNQFTSLLILTIGLSDLPMYNLQRLFHAVVCRLENVFK